MKSWLIRLAIGACLTIGLASCGAPARPYRKPSVAPKAAIAPPAATPVAAPTPPVRWRPAESLLIDLTAVQEPAHVPDDRNWKTATSRQFIDRFCPYAQLTANSLGVHPAPILAQAALETGWGKHRPGAGFNLFGIKAGKSWKGKVTLARTWEVYDGKKVWITAPFRDYSSFAHAWYDYHRVIGGNKHFRKAVLAGTDWRAYIQAVKDGGYATDPLYVQKVTSIVTKHRLAAVCPP